MPTPSAEAYGVPYTPNAVGAFTNSSRARSGKTMDNTSFLDDHGIKYFRVQWVDLTNTVRCRIVPRAHMLKLLQTPRPGITTNHAILGIVGQAIAPGFSDVGERVYLIDPMTLRICTYAPGHASVMGVFQEKTPSPRYGLDVPTCPRTQLKRIEQAAKTDIGIVFLVGFEIEFTLLKEFNPETGEFVAANDAEYSAAAKLPTGAKETIIMEAIIDALVTADVEVLMMHPEAASGQYEIVTGPLTPVEAVDALVFTTETIRNITAKHGYRATFAPRPYANQFGSGLHAHISVHETKPIVNPEEHPTRDDADLRLAPTLTAVERSFLQGMLCHLPALCAFTLPTPASYSRVADGIVSGGSYVVWGSDNREVPIRLCGMPRSESAGGHHFEVKCLDSTACAYVALAGLLGMGADAIRRGLSLTHKDCNSKGVCEMTAEEKTEFGVTDEEVRRLPRSVEEARNALEADRDVVELLGEQFVGEYLSVNKLLQATLEGSDKQDEMARLIKRF